MDGLFFKLPNNMELIYLPLILCAMFVHFLSEPLRWFFYIGKLFNLGYNRIFSIFSLTALVNYLLPMKMGVPTRIFLLRNKAGVGIMQCSALLILDGIINYACWGLTAATSMYLLVNRESINADFTIIAVASVLIILLLAGVWNKRRLVMPNRTCDENDETRINNKGSVKYLISSMEHRILLKSFLVMPVDIGSHIVHHWAIFSMLGINLEWSAVFVITTVSVFTGLISMMPMGLGGYDAMLVLLLTHFSVAPEFAISVAIINRLTSLFISIITGIYGGTQLELNPFKLKWREQISEKTSRTP